MSEVELTRREFVKHATTGLAAGLAAANLNAGDVSTAGETVISSPLPAKGPELLLVSQLGVGHPLIRSLVAQLNYILLLSEERN